mgnify:CR=1 FL=1
MMKKIFKSWKFYLSIFIAAIIAAAVFHFTNTSKSGGYSFKTVPVTQDDLVSSISASGTVEPEELVNVGAQVSGKIMSFGTDNSGSPVDYGSKVSKGMLLAQIDDVLYAAALRESKAQKLQAEAAITSAKAAIRQAQAKRNLAQINWVRAQELHKKSAMAKSEYDAAEADFISSQADCAAAEASLEQANAQLAIAEAALVKAQRNMDYCAITSPVDGIIIDRRVSIGQTVVSNMSASSIFLIAKDFKKMQVWVSVNEADIGKVKAGMPVEFTIDTFPDTVFYGKVKKIRLNATMSQNVVTYIVEVVTDNVDGKLIPYLTANVKFIRNKRENVLCIPNAALRFMPDKKLIHPDYRDKKYDSRVVFVPEGKFLRPVPVKTGLSAGARVELLESELSAGDKVVFAVSEIEEKNDGNQDAKSPFMPTPQNRGIRGGGSAANRARAAGQK